MSMFYELMMRKKEQIMYATIKGTLTENDGVFSGFSYNNYLATQEIFDYSKDFEIVLKINTGTIEGQNQLIRNNYGSNMGSFGFVISIESNKIRSYIKDSEGNNISNGAYGTTTFSNNNDYFLKLSQKLNNGTYAIKIESSTDGITWVTENNWTSSYPIKNSGQGFALGGGTTTTTAYWRGSIDLPNSYIKLGATKYKLQAVVGYTIVGSPTIVDGVVSGFSSANYLTLNQIYNAKNIMNTEIYIRAKTPSSFSSGFSYIFSNTSGYASIFSLAVSSGIAFISFMGSNLAGTTLAFSDIYISGNAQNNTWYRFKIKGNNGLWVFEVYDDNGNLLGRNTKDWTNLTLDQNYRIKLICLAGANSGEIDLNETYIKINNKLWFNGQQA